MYDSLKSFIDVAYQYRPFLKYNGAGTAQYDKVIDSKCYPVGDTQVVTNEEGVEVTSNTQLYVDGTEPIKVRDQVIFNGEARKIIRINDFYRNGIIDLRVVYL